MNDLLILCYHAVSARWSAPLSVTPDQLERQLRALTERGYTGATFTAAVTSPTGGRQLVVTFDDGYRSVLELGLPILRRLGLPGTIFVPTDYIGQERSMAWSGIEHWLGTPDEPDLMPLSWAELRELRDAGWEIGSHTRSHPRLSRLDDAALSDELAGARETCEAHLGRPCHALAYPYGDFDERVVGAARRSGYLAAGTLSARLLEGSTLETPRIGIYHADAPWRFRLKVASGTRALRASSAWDFAQRLRAARASPVHRDDGT